MRGRKPKPTAFKKMTGNPGKRRLNKNEPTLDPRIPSMPKWLKKFPDAVREWRHDSKIMLKMKTLTDADAWTLAKYCFVGSQIIKLSVEVDAEGYTIEQPNGGTSANPKVLRLEKMMGEHRQLGSLLGLDPASRAKLNIQQAPEDPLEAFLKKKESSQGLTIVGGQKK
jgi:P27 family predicted phage terminase small subunit